MQSKVPSMLAYLIDVEARGFDSSLMGEVDSGMMS